MRRASGTDHFIARCRGSRGPANCRQYDEETRQDKAGLPCLTFRLRKSCSKLRSQHAPCFDHNQSNFAIELAMWSLFCFQQGDKHLRADPWHMLDRYLFQVACTAAVALTSLLTKKF
ncbi:uncharacterized protein PV09_09515 [Verruconis gallopava]|uniref:Uncharacterized protein n=1 Tax=Verruconis gallopava TaxID=253628 RepID=A0A0D1ZW64_9PEZI|nr:uncharacterized protein PV09_09515 [Verruconis gallopava]KIV98732.1 hypothetical protein PV09_09515 [Verruconis gallopava]